MEDIFLFKKMPVDKKRTIIVDTREKNSMVPAYLFKLKMNVVFEKLDVGDYIVNDIVVERKTASDFFSSIYSGRIKEQVKNMIEIKQKIILIEGLMEYKKFNKNVFWGFFSSYCMTLGVPILFVNNEKETAEFLKFMSCKNVTVGQVRYSKKAKSIEEKKIFFLEGIYGIGNKKAKELLKQFGNIKNIINLSKEDFLPILSLKDIEEFYSIIL